MTSEASVVPAELIEVYGRTEFRVLGAQNFTLQVGKFSEPLHCLFEVEGVSSAAFVTAWNPYSSSTAADDNHRAQATFRKRLDHEGYSTIDGFGIDPTTDWAGEDSVLVLGMSLIQAKILGQEVKQNAIVWIGEDAVPMLVMLR